MSFDIKLRFENACRTMFSKLSLVNLISKDTHLVFYISVYKLVYTLNTSVYDVINDFPVDSTPSMTFFKKWNVTLTC